ncbi:hypothetical protein BaRGS_00002640 [Batillaria attramentaria]|uniref:Uncharacterized protein n=1 Tax=Batillaria attramentaria TaxID=370345 RepID=A0ABD0M3H2_9CAEN
MKEQPKNNRFRFFPSRNVTELDGVRMKLAMARARRGKPGSRGRFSAEGKTQLPEPFSLRSSCVYVEALQGTGVQCRSVASPTKHL